MSTLHSLIEHLATDPSVLTDVEVEEELAEVARAMDVLQARFLRLTAEVDRRRPFLRDGVLSTSRRLAVTCDMANSTARETVTVARALPRMPLTRAGFEAGDLSYSKVRILARAAGEHPESFVAHEDTLVDVAGRLTVRDLRRAVDYWRQQLDGPLPMADMIDRSYVHASRTWQGMVRLDALLDPEAGETVIAALESAMAVPAARAAAGETPTASRRRARALTHVCRAFLHRPTSGGGRPHVDLIVDLDTLQGRAGGVCELAHTGPVPAETARRLACDAQLSRVITRGRSEPLEIGRKSRTVTAAQRRAVVIRDRCCRFPDCDRSPPWSDVHHIVHWVDGGRTDLDNLILVCRRHHTLIHEHGFRLSGTAREPTFRRPDGSILTAARQPASATTSSAI